ncbi:MAG TPA: spore coat protein CotJB [Chondromyces sp.]|nr:spore coat protein CotJB [Chondromyces sp.]
MKKMPPAYYKELEAIQAVDFAIVDLALYLHTHPDDQNAIQQYNLFVKQSKKLKKEYEKKYGPMTSFGYSYSNYPFNYKEAPWPWQV